MVVVNPTTCEFVSHASQADETGFQKATNCVHPQKSSTPSSLCEFNGRTNIRPIHGTYR